MEYHDEIDTARDRSPVEAELDIIHQELQALHERAKYYIERTSLVLQPQTSKGTLNPVHSATSAAW